MTVTSTTPASASTSTTAASSTGKDALSSLSGNLNDFLNLLMTQLQNQDPTAPMDSTTFTTQLVQFASVEQQINANSNLNTLIQATQSNTLLQSSSLVGKQVQVTSDHLALQNSTATVNFSAPAAEPVDVGVYTDAGVKVYETAMTAQPGNNSWTWNGQDSQGNQLADGAYKVIVADSTGTGLSTTVDGTVTGMQRNGTAVDLVLGGLTTDVSNLQSVQTGS